ncbi:MAG: glutathione S-transferase C-terminal domain-containing protein [Chthoniobacter sp.]
MNAQFPEEQNDDGEFERQEDAFRDWVSNDGSTPYPAISGRYHLYVSLACPWASRTVIVRHLLRLEEAIGCTVVDPIRDDRGWAFRDGPGYSHDPIEGFTFLSEAYLASDPQFHGRVTVPVLWDKVTRRIVNNSEDDICRMLAVAFAGLAAPGGRLPELFPAAIETEHQKWAAFIYERVNNGVYRAGFASSQRAYEAAFRTLFAALEELDARLATRRYLFGTEPVEADWRLFCTLVRFDAVYFGHFKCNLRRIVDFAHLDGYLRDLYQLPGIAPTVNLDHIKRHYYFTHDDINPTRIVPLGPPARLHPSARPRGADAKVVRSSRFDFYSESKLELRATLGRQGCLAGIVSTCPTASFFSSTM